MRKKLTPRSSGLYSNVPDTGLGFLHLPEDINKMSADEMRTILLNISATNKNIIDNVTKQQQSENALQIQHDLSLALSSCNDIDLVFKQVLKAVMRLDGIDCGGIYIADQDGGLDLIVHHGLSPQFVKEKKYFSANTQQARMAREGKIIYDSYKNIKAKTGLLNNNDDLHAIAIIPVIFEGELLAVLNFASHSHNEILLSTRNVLETIAQQIGSSIIRVNYNEALRESRENLQTLFDTVTDLLFVLNDEGTILQTNSIACKKLGYTTDEIIGLNVMEIHPHERRTEAGEIISEMLSGKRDYCPIPLITKDGKLIPVETHVSIGIWGGKSALFGISRDITERKKTQKALMESQEMYKQLFESATDALFIINTTTGMIIEANKCALEMYGYNHDEILTKKSMDLSAEPNITKKLTTEASELPDNSIKNISLRYHKRKDGTLFPVEITARNILLNENKVLLVSTRDITERQQIADALHESETRLREVLENSIDASYKRTFKNGNYEYLSPVFATITGYTPAEMGDMTIDEVTNMMHPDDINEVNSVINDIINNKIKTTYQIEYRFKHKSGNYRWLHDKFTVIKDNNDTPLALIGSVSDITERKIIKAKLMDAYNRLENIIEGTNAGTWEWNVQTGDTVFNERWAQIIGYTLN